MAILDQQPTSQAANTSSGVLNANPFDAFIDTVAKKYKIPREQAKSLVMAAHNDNNIEVDDSVESMIQTAGNDGLNVGLDATNSGQSNAVSGALSTVGDYWGDVMDTKSGEYSKAAGYADKAFGTKGAITGAYNAVSNAYQHGVSEAAKSLGKTGAQATISAISKYSGVPISSVMGMFGNAAQAVKSGMTPEDAMFGVALDFGIDLGLIGFGSLFGPIGTVLGGIVAGMINTTSLTDGMSAAVNDWGKDAQIGANVAALEGMQALGVTKALGYDDVEDFGALKDAMKAYGTDSTDVGRKAMKDMSDTYGGKHGMADGGYGAMSQTDADATDAAGGVSVGHGGLSGQGLLGHDADAADNDAGRTGQSGGKSTGGSSGSDYGGATGGYGGMSQSDADATDSGGGNDNDGDSGGSGKGGATGGDKDGGRY